MSERFYEIYNSPETIVDNLIRNRMIFNRSKAAIWGGGG